MSRAATAELPSIAADLVRWQRQHGRHGLPWQASRDPYRVWLSEVMLQQTQVATVLGYYERFLQRFPDIAALAAAPLDDVLALWSGLGYYSRARNLHRCAQVVVAEHGAALPRRAEQLVELPGIGPSTAAAIASFCHGERVSIFDGNVKRVLARLLAFEGDLAQAGAAKVLWAQADRLVPTDAADMPAYTQGLMDLGATVCTPRDPQCPACPLQRACRAHAAGSVLTYPIKSRKLKRSRRENWCLWLSLGDAVWLQQRPDTGIWAGLWAWPLFDDTDAVERLTAQLLAALGGHAERLQANRLPGFVHVLTHLDWTLHPCRLHLPAPVVLQAREPGGGDGERGDGPLERLDAVLNQQLGAGRWHAAADLHRLGLPAPLRKVLLDIT
ncbi:A/G-specific adenine glycosylase [Leptothrix cholodnii SP-6]|uniref:Adenine DNA glycosylase n=1 Tax=Leptothrix cholodnii (strain ATCC 51168 / LMG 8142 / SP-6) TaxID=395495 RepID=B1Y3P3_LEPCP|nr:A/G-specific adenine glycosylase [Leptothrix cholodnii]ACB35746.1 A/G-specific adenine glycosylase [Leptothrix cholodnii SP-6]